MPKPQFSVDANLFYMLARHFFSTTRQGTFTRSAVVQRLEKIQTEVLARRQRQELEVPPQFEIQLPELEAE